MKPAVLSKKLIKIHPYLIVILRGAVVRIKVYIISNSRFQLHSEMYK